MSRRESMNLVRQDVKQTSSEQTTVDHGNNTPLDNAAILQLVVKLTQCMTKPESEARNAEIREIANTIEGFKEQAAESGRRVETRKFDIPISKMPELGENDNCIIKPKELGISTLRYSRENSKEVIAWLSRVASVCKGRTKRVWLETLARSVTGDIYLDILEFQEDETLEVMDITSRIEHKWGDVLTPREAQAKLTKFPPIRSGKEVVHKLEEVETLAKWACRNDTKEQRAYKVPDLTVAVFRRCIPHSALTSITDRNDLLIQMGSPEYGVADWKREIVRYFRQNVELMAESQTMRKGEESINKVHQSGQYTPYANNGEYTPENDYRNEPQGGSATAVQGSGINFLDAPKVQFAEGICRIFPATVGVERDECMKCGSKEHFMKGKGSENCPYRRDKLVEKCNRCQRGGHESSKCIRRQK